MSSRLAGTRQVRNSIRHIIFSSRVFYGIPVFMTFTPSERHNGLMIRLYRGRVKDPVAHAAVVSRIRSHRMVFEAEDCSFFMATYIQ